MMASDEVSPPEGVAHAVAAHTSRIAQVIPLLTNYYVFSLGERILDAKADWFQL